LAFKIASAGAVRENPAEAFAKGGNSDEHQESILKSRFLVPNDTGERDFCSWSNITSFW